MGKVQCSKYPKEKCRYCEEKTWLLCDTCKWNMYQSPVTWRESQDYFEKYDENSTPYDNVVQCNHHWIFQEKLENHKTNVDGYGNATVTFTRIDRYYCSNCCEVKELTKEDKFSVRNRTITEMNKCKPVWFSKEF